MNAELETGDMRVVTLRVPTNDPSELTVAAIDHTVRILGPDGFRKEITLADEADMDRLHAELFHGILELRAPTAHADAPHWAHEVRVAGEF